MFIDLFDSLGTMLAVCREAGLADEKGEIKQLPAMLRVDAVATVAGAVLGTSTTTAYIKSASGVAVGRAHRFGGSGHRRALFFSLCSSNPLSVRFPAMQRPLLLSPLEFS
jgi:AGZA family xanthine/uracil permease-like MFS transporter